MSANGKNLIRGATGDWEVVIGMEVHAQVTSKAKLFSGASTEFGGAPNAHVSLVDAAMPGMLPVINAECVRQAVRTGLGLKAQINLKSVFDRKNYFYPDLPQGYQISQYKEPIVGEGQVVVDLEDGESFTVGIERLQRSFAELRFAPAEDEYYYQALLYEALGAYTEARAEWSLYAAVPDAPWRHRALEHVRALDALRAPAAAPANPHAKRSVP